MISPPPPPHTDRDALKIWTTDFGAWKNNKSLQGLFSFKQIRAKWLVTMLSQILNAALEFCLINR